MGFLYPCACRGPIPVSEGFLVLATEFIKSVEVDGRSLGHGALGVLQ